MDRLKEGVGGRDGEMIRWKERWMDGGMMNRWRERWRD